MSSHYFRKAFSAKLSKILTLWVFGSLIAIEAIILLPSYFKRERDLLAAQVGVVEAKLDTALIYLGDDLDDGAAVLPSSPALVQSLDQSLAQMKREELIVDYAMTTGQEAAVLAVQSDLLAVDTQHADSAQLPAELREHQPRLDRIRQTYEYTSYLQQVQPPLSVLVNYDTRSIQAELNAYTMRMLGMILLISVVVTGTTMVSVERCVIRPILYLRADLLTAIDNIQHNDAENKAAQQSFQSAQLERKDELGEVITTFLFLYEKIWESMAAQKLAYDAEVKERLRANQLDENIVSLKQTQAQLIQAEKMLGLSQLVAGVAHEINNPITFIHGNVRHLNEYAEDLLSLVQLYQAHYPDPPSEIAACLEDKDIDFVQEDFPKLLSSMQMGSTRVRNIILSLRNFSRLDESDIKRVDIHEGLESTLSLLGHRLGPTAHRPRIEIVREYGSLPQVECYAGLLNQVFLSILSNAIEAFNTMRMADDVTVADGASDEAVKVVASSGMRNVAARLEVESGPKQSEPEQKEGGLWPLWIELRTAVVDGHCVRIAIANNGPPISEEIQKRIFEPFFTTKRVGDGTGMGLATSYQIVTIKHAGKLSCLSTPAFTPSPDPSPEQLSYQSPKTEFIIQIPINQSD